MALLFANTDFEIELEGQELGSLEKPTFQPLLILQLQFLSLLYANPGDCLVVSYAPDEDFQRQIEEKGCFWKRLQDSYPKGERLLSWGASLRVAKWASQKGVIYEIPPWEVVRKVNSKAYSFLNAPPLQGSALLRDREEVMSWLRNGPEVRVLKSCFGLSGRGHFLIQKESDKNRKALSLFIEKELAKGVPLIGEPWLERVFDFSTQWEITQEGKLYYLGATHLLNRSGGSYLGNRLGPEVSLFGAYEHFLEKHKEVAYHLLAKVALEGYKGYVGVDSFIYKAYNQLYLHPVVEINARMTMGLALLLFHKRSLSSQLTEVSYQAPYEGPGLLPQAIWKEGILTPFNRQLVSKNLKYFSVQKKESC